MFGCKLFAFAKSSHFCKMVYAIPSCLGSKSLMRYHQQDTRFCWLIGLSSRRLPTHTSLCLHSRRYASDIGGPTAGQIDLQGKDVNEDTQTEQRNARFNWSPTLFKMFETAATTFASILVLGLAGYGYHRVRAFLLNTYPIGLPFDLQAMIQK